jgi:CBS-domain-containing membrane protein
VLDDVNRVGSVEWPTGPIWTGGHVMGRELHPLPSPTEIRGAFERERLDIKPHDVVSRLREQNRAETVSDPDFEDATAIGKHLRRELVARQHEYEMAWIVMKLVAGARAEQDTLGAAQHLADHGIDRIDIGLL